MKKIAKTRIKRLPVRFALDSEQCELLLEFEQRRSLQDLADAMGRDISVISRQLQKLADQCPVIEKTAGRWQLTALGSQMNAWTRSAVGTQQKMIAQYRNLRSPISSVPLISPRTVLILINVQEGFDDARWGVRNCLEAEENMAKLLAEWRKTRRPILFVKHQSVEPKSPLRARTLATRIKSIVAPRSEEQVVEKSRNSAFAENELLNSYRASGVDSLLFVGIPLDHCVAASIRSASDSGFRCFVATDATVSFDRMSHDGQLVKADEIHVATLAALHQEFATVVSTETILRQSADEENRPKPSGQP